jgi:hypothetical protein
VAGAWVASSPKDKPQQRATDKAKPDGKRESKKPRVNTYIDREFFTI